MSKKKNKKTLTFIDLFAGCGGMSLGLMQAGYEGILAMEVDPMAFETLKENLIKGPWRRKFNWPEELFPCKPHRLTKYFLEKYNTELKNLRGKIDLVVGGPPCQGFSNIGERNPRDPRNQLPYRYVDFIKLVLPKYVLMENTMGISSAFKNHKKSKGNSSYGNISFSQRIITKLESLDYKCIPIDLNSVKYGVPQSRIRHFIIGVRQPKNTQELNNLLSDKELDKLRIKFLKQKGLSQKGIVSVEDAISDLTHDGTTDLASCGDRKGYKQISYKGPNNSTYQKLMHGKLNGASPNSMALTKHRDDTIKKFEILRKLQKKIGRRYIPTKNLISIGITKHRITVQIAEEPSTTITTLPDDVLHYCEPRILTVRECARIQSFPDNFTFTGKYTTGGALRKQECPRYTQVGNAVPPFLAEFIGLLIKNVTKI